MIGGFFSVLFEVNEIHVDGQVSSIYPYSDSKWIDAFLKEVDGSVLKHLRIFVLKSPDGIVSECIKTLTSMLIQQNKHLYIESIEMSVHKAEEVNATYCDAIIGLISELPNLRKIEIQSRDNFFEIYKYIIMGSNITSLAIGLSGIDSVDCNYNRGLLAIADIFKRACKDEKYTHDIDVSIGYALKSRRTTLSLPSVIFNKSSQIDELEIYAGKWSEVKMVLASYPPLKKFTTNNPACVKGLRDDRTICPDLTNLGIYMYECSTDMMVDIVGWSRLTDSMKSLKFKSLRFEPGALEYLLDDIISPSESRTHIEACALMFSSSQSAVGAKIKNILDNRKKAFEVGLIARRLQLSPSTVQQIVVGLLQLNN